ncbi:HAD family hydrolase [Cellulomonas sp. URHD0024]|uniref:HAD family hydrolase n=1 Tax=Cellulomonas sp. URHD0024 TaxID=1302620 RepID=UPI0004243743|nr:HAD family hydrolase [Cellulomonas sp. URHD0024]
MSPHQIDGILFDIDDTLVDTRAAFGTALATIARRYLPDVTPDQDADVVSFWRADASDHFGRYTRGEIGQVEQRMSRANELHERFGGPALDDEGFAAWDGVFDSTFREAWSAHEDVDAVLGRLLDAGLHLGALTNAATAYQTDKLERTGLADRMPLLVALDTLGFGKPDPRVFAEACRLLGTDPGRTAYVGDELDVDAAAARRAGLIGIWLDRPCARRLPVTDEEIVAAGVLVISSLDDLPGLLGI